MVVPRKAKGPWIKVTEQIFPLHRNWLRFGLCYGLLLRRIWPWLELDSKAQSWPSSLSGGQKQRVALVSEAVMLADRVIVLDEGAIGLDVSIQLSRTRVCGLRGAAAPYMI